MPKGNSNNLHDERQKFMGNVLSRISGRIELFYVLLSVR